MADAGGGTLDISSYAIKGVSPLLIEEIAPPDCTSSFSLSGFVSNPPSYITIFIYRSLLWFSICQPPSEEVFGTQTSRFATVLHSYGVGSYRQAVRRNDQKVIPD